MLYWCTISRSHRRCWDIQQGCWLHLPSEPWSLSHHTFEIFSGWLSPGQEKTEKKLKPSKQIPFFSLWFKFSYFFSNFWTMDTGACPHICGPEVCTYSLKTVVITRERCPASKGVLVKSPHQGLVQRNVKVLWESICFWKLLGAS